MGIQNWKLKCFSKHIEIEKICIDVVPISRTVTCRLFVDGKKIKESTKFGFILLNPLAAGEPIAAQIEGDDGTRHLIEVKFPQWPSCKVFVDGEFVFKGY